MKRMSLALLLLIVGGGIPFIVRAETDIERRIPEEIETAGGHALSVNNSGAAALAGVSAIRVNPGLLPLEPQYSISAAYNWPSAGRDFYQLGVVDSLTSPIAAGFIYTGFVDKLDEKARAERDARVDRRMALAIGKSFTKVAMGINVGYVSAYPLDLPGDATSDERVRGTTVGAGIAGLLTDQLRVGVAAENLNNRRVRSYAPETIRAGIAYLVTGGSVSLHLDYRQRARVDYYENNLVERFGSALIEERDEKTYETPEKMVLASFSAKVYDMVRVLGSYGRAISSDDRQNLAGGIGLVQQNFSLSFNLARPYLKYHETQNNVNLNILISL